MGRVEQSRLLTVTPLGVKLGLEGPTWKSGAARLKRISHWTDTPQATILLGWTNTPVM
jgi:hypothetical protein